MGRDASPDTRLDPTRERALVGRARVDASAFGELYDYYLPRIHGFVLRRLGDRTAAEDVTAMTFERALSAIRRDDFRNDSFGGWLYRVAANAVVDHVRRSRRTVPLGRRASDAPGAYEDSAATIGDERAERALTAALDRDELRRGLALLSDGHRQVIVLRFLDGLEGEALAGALGCSRSAAAVKVHRALRAMRDAVTAESIDAA
jgi:RNA polymerase sigma-70 factor (ECF subfamily)